MNAIGGKVTIWAEPVSVDFSETLIVELEPLLND